MSSTVLLLLLVAALALIAIRVYAKLRAARKLRAESWDEQVIGRLRSQGYAPFKDYRVDFFLALPNEAACAGARARLGRGGAGAGSGELSGADGRGGHARRA